MFPSSACLSCHDLIFHFISFSVVDPPASGAACHWRGSEYADGHVWQNSCNTCRCQNGLVTCTKLWCGARNCIELVNDVLKLTECGAGQVRVDPCPLLAHPLPHSLSGLHS